MSDDYYNSGTHRRRDMDEDNDVSPNFSHGGVSSDFESPLTALTQRRQGTSRNTLDDDRGIVQLATHSTLMSNPTYKSVYERSQLFENRAAMFEDKYKRMKTDFEAQKKSMTRRDRLEVKMKESLDTFETISSDMKIMLQGFKSGAETVLSAAGTRSSTPINPLSGFDFPKKPEREDKQNALLWWENCTAPNSGVSTASKGGKKSDVTPYPYVDEKGELVDYLEYRRCRTTIRDVLTRLQQQTPGILVAGWLSNSDTTKEAVMQAVYPKHPWLALADGHYKFHKLVSSVHSEAGRRIKSKVGAAQGGSETPAGSVKKEGHSSSVKREHSEDASCGGGESRPRKKAKAPAPEPDANLACVATAAAHQPEDSGIVTAGKESPDNQVPSRYLDPTCYLDRYLRTRYTCVPPYLYPRYLSIRYLPRTIPYLPGTSTLPATSTDISEPGIPAYLRTYTHDISVSGTSPVRSRYLDPVPLRTYTHDISITGTSLISAT
ncbi:hypothetical protein DFP72DRAFT_1062110 [Ephemerocybe angulata]|uniref:Uncharacterized protein n=1 Tax=Ephemerocybe angulata TaxID=980116 RepID=A0A8H6IBD8_9AGAR|nr:hypothetical protein DFP72DRAFT_1062110 [Tulosesus angulatus]